MRDSTEFIAGHIKDAENLPSGHFVDGEFTKNVIQSHLHYKTLVVHCGKSHHRAPKCARALQSALDKLSDSSYEGALPEM